MVVAAANVNDHLLARATTEAIAYPRPMPTAERPQGMCRDKGYDYPGVRAADLEHGFTPHIRSRGEERRASRAWDGERPRRWVVERLISWLNRFRRLLVRWEKKDENYLALNQFACGLIVWRSTGLFG